MVALKNQMCLMMESPTINVVGEKRGPGDDRWWFIVLSRFGVDMDCRGRRGGNCIYALSGASLTEGFPVSFEQGTPPERWVSASFKNLRRDEDVLVARDKVCWAAGG